MVRALATAFSFDDAADEFVEGRARIVEGVSEGGRELVIGPDGVELK